MICRTADDAWQAGWDAPCEHGNPDPTACQGCALRPEEIALLVTLHSPHLRPTVTSGSTAAA